MAERRLGAAAPCSLQTLSHGGEIVPFQGLLAWPERLVVAHSRSPLYSIFSCSELYTFFQNLTYLQSQNSKFQNIARNWVLFKELVIKMSWLVVSVTTIITQLWELENITDDEVDRARNTSLVTTIICYYLFLSSSNCVLAFLLNLVASSFTFLLSNKTIGASSCLTNTWIMNSWRC